MNNAETPDPATDRPDAAMATDRASWLARMDEICLEEGYFEPLGQSHWAFFVDDGPNLFVTFETLESIRSGSPKQMPMGCCYSSGRNWSHLCIISDGPTWYRDQAVYRYFDRLVDDAFFEDFDRVVFYGAGMGGYAACAFSVTAPGASVVAVQPRATLDPSYAGWDSRHTAQRRLNFNDRYGYAPDMIEGTGKVFVVYDPHQREDAMHAALFRKPFVTALPVRNLGERVDLALQNMQLLQPILDAACDDTLTASHFAALLRARRNYGPYLKTVLALSENSGRTHHAIMTCRSVVKRLNAPRFRRRLAELMQEQHNYSSSGPIISNP